jgi:hypothetical protein
MKNFLLRSFYLIVTFLVLSIIYLSTIGLETDKFNDQIKDKIYKTNNSLEADLKKIKLTLDPINFKINVKTVGTNISYKGKNLPLEYINSEISILSLIKGKIVSTEIKISTRSVLLKDLVALTRTTLNKPELILLEKSINKGQAIINAEINLDDSGNIIGNYQINAILKDAKIGFLKNYNFDKINFSLNAKKDVFKFEDLSFSTSNTDFFSNNLQIIKNQKNYSIKGDVENKNSVLNEELLKLFNIDLENIEILNNNFNSKNIFSFNLDKRFKIENLDIASNIAIQSLDYQRPSNLDDYFPEQNNIIKFIDHEIELIYKKSDLTIDGFGKVKLDKKFDDIKYKINSKNKNLDLKLNLNLSEFSFNKNENLKYFFPQLRDVIDLKDHLIEIDYNKDNFQIKSKGEIKLTNEFEKISFNVLKTKDDYKFDTKIDLEKTLLNIDILDFKKKNDLKTSIEISGNYNSNKSINLNKASIISKDNKITLENLFINVDNQIINIDKLDLDFFDNQNKKNKILLTKVNKNTFKIDGSILNADKLIENLLNSKDEESSKIFRDDFDLILNLKKVYLDDQNVIRDFKGKLIFKDNKVFFADIFANFNKTDNFKYTVNTNDNNEKITTFFSSRAKPFVSRYKFIKGYEEGYLDFYSSKKDGLSKSKLKIYDFKLQELPALTKLLTLASLQGIADTLSGEGIRFNEFEMNFISNKNLMTIDEIYAIGPAISILMEGYIEEDKLVSLRGTLVPATTINKSIGSIPFIGKILVGDKTGEGVFGVSFKIKGPPKNLETSVNPIKTLTPRFITRTLEKIKN